MHELRQLARRYPSPTLKGYVGRADALIGHVASRRGVGSTGAPAPSLTLKGYVGRADALIGHVASRRGVGSTGAPAPPLTLKGCWDKDRGDPVAPQPPRETALAILAILPLTPPTIKLNFCHF